MPKISFVIPTRDRGYLIRDTLKSLQAQTISDWEAIVVDDHGTDNTKQIVRGMKDPRIKYHAMPEARGSGAASARNYGNMIATSKILAVLDSDDICIPDRAAVTLKSYREHKWDFFSGGRFNLDNATGKLLPPKKKMPEQWNAKLFKTGSKNYVTHSSVAYTKKAAMEIPYNSALPCFMDYDLISRFIESGKKMYFTPQPLVLWRRHPNTLSAANSHQTAIYKGAIRAWRGWDRKKVDSKILIS